MLHVDLYPAAVRLVAKRDLSKDYQGTSSKNQTIHLPRPEDVSM